MLIRHGVYDPQKLGIQDIMKVSRKQTNCKSEKSFSNFQLIFSGILYDQRYFNDGR